MPKYLDIANEIRSNIQKDIYPEGTMLPTEEQLCEQYGASRQTIRQALSILVKENLISKQRGSGSTVTSQARPPRSYHIAVITTYISDYIFPGILREAEAVFSDHKYSALIAATRNRVTNERSILLDMLSKPIDGFLIEGTKTALPNPNLDLYQKLIDQKVPVVFFSSYYPELKDTICVYSDNYGGGYQLVQYLLQKGHTKIAGIFKSDDIQGHQRYAGYISALRDSGNMISDEDVCWYTTENQEYILNASLIDQLQEATAVVCYNDEVAFTLIRLLQENGKAVPQDLAVVSFDNSYFSDISPVKITSLSYGDRNIGRVAAEKLIRMLDGEAAVSEALPWILVEKESSLNI